MSDEARQQLRMIYTHLEDCLLLLSEARNGLPAQNIPLIEVSAEISRAKQKLSKIMFKLGMEDVVQQHIKQNWNLESAE